MHDTLPQISQPAGQPGVYTVGTLRYDKRALAVLFAWLLWGDFAFNFFESIFGRFLPLYLNDLNASNTLIGITTGSIAGAVNILFLPTISQWSDHVRSRWGRRIPLLIVVAPLTTLSLLGIGFAPEIAGWITRHAPAPLAPWLNATTLIVAVLCSFTIGFHFFNMVLVNAYNWLLRDVVPEPLMARFLSWFRVVGNIAGVFFLWYVFPTMMSHRKETFTGVSIFYLVAFGVMCWKVKEGDYPAPDSGLRQRSLAAGFVSYFRDCLALPIYRHFFSAYVCVLIGGCCAAPFITLYSRNGLHLTMDEMGQYAAYTIIANSVLLIPAGYLCDKFSAMKVVLVSTVLMVFVPLLAYWFVDTKQSFLAYSLWSVIPSVTWGLGYTALSMTLFPGQFFGQFSAGLNVFGCGGLILGNFFAGKFMDLTGGDYRLIFLWTLAFNLLAILPLSIVYREWKRYGGLHNYVPPIPDHLR